MSVSADTYGTDLEKRFDLEPGLFLQLPPTGLLGRLARLLRPPDGP